MISPFNALQLALGPVVWLVWFSVIYGLLSVVCAVAPPPAEQGPLTWIHGVLFLLTLAVTALLLYWAWRCYQAAKKGTANKGAAKNPTLGADTDERVREEAHGSRHFIAYVAAGAHGVAAVSTLGVGSMVLYLPACL